MRKKSATQRIHRLQKKIFQALKIQADDLLGKPLKAIQQYARGCQKDFKIGSPIPSISHTSLIDRICQTQITCIADFHTFDQSQKTALRIAREAFHSPQTAAKNLTWQIGLEMIPSEFQRALDEFQAGLLDLEEFHQIISYSEKWGFAWSQYQPLFDWAKTHGLRLIALNCESSSPQSDLHLRDHWAARILTDIYAQAGEQAAQLRTLVLFGEWHVGTRHLPAQIDRLSQRLAQPPSRGADARPGAPNITWITVHQTEESLYWKWIAQEKNFTTRVAQLGPRIYCIFSSTPWAKLQSLVNWTEHGPLQAPQDALEDTIEDELDADVDHPTSLDYLSLVATQGQHLAEFFTIPSPMFESLTLRTIDEADFIEHRAVTRAYTKNELRILHFLVQSNRDFYLSRVQVAYLGSPSLHRISEAAAHHLLQQCGRMKDRKRMTLSARGSKEFQWKVFEFTFSFFCTLVLNPHRKCELPSDHIARIEQLTKKLDRKSSTRELFAGEVDVRQLILKILQMDLKKRRKNYFEHWTTLKTIPENLDALQLLLAARYLGRIRGHTLYQDFLREQVTLAEIRGYFLRAKD